MPALAIRRLTTHLASMSNRRHTGLSPSGFLRAIIDHRLPLESIREPCEPARPINVSVTSFGVFAPGDAPTQSAGTFDRGTRPVRVDIGVLGAELDVHRRRQLALRQRPSGKE